MPRTKGDAAISFFSTLMAEQNTKVLSERTREFFSDTDRLRRIALQRQNMMADKAQGFVFEQLEVSKFNLDALFKNSSYKATTTDALGEINNPIADIRIKNSETGEVVKSYQAKSCAKPSHTLFELRNPKYEEVSLVGPSEQHQEMQKLINDRTEKAESIYAPQYESAKKRLDQGIQHDGVQSGGTTHEEAIANTNAATAAQTASKMEWQAIGNEMHKAGMQAGTFAGTVGGGVALAGGLWKLHKGEVTPTQVALDTIYAGVGSFATGYASAATAKGIPHLLTGMGISDASLGSLTRSNAHVAIASGIIQSTKHVAQYLKGDIDFDEMVNQVGGTAIIGASSFYYGALGQVLIPIPVVGAMVGSSVGYFVGNILHQSGVISLGESAQVRVARERRERIEQLCVEAVARMQAARLAMTELMEEHFAAQAAALSTAFDDMDEAMMSWDADGFMKGLTNLNSTFSLSLPFHDFESFENFMHDDDAVFVL
ncbi:hypothetical protein ACCD06_01635 [Azospirillum sp. CT11-132]|uniref:hypothetical protein n=1 Tax=Azospirillum sp. CT11-132 TaxID=3396317 RepID=UPI0039A4E8E3